MTESLNLAPRMREQLLRWRWVIVALAAAFFFAFEVIEHYPLTTSLASADFIREALLFGIFGPLLAGIVLSLLANTRAERVQVDQHLNLERDLGRQLASAHSWDELTALVVRLPRIVLPVFGASLLVHGEGQDQFDAVAEWWDRDWQLPTTPILHSSPRLCDACVSARSSPSVGSYQCHCLDGAQVPGLGNRRCLPLVHGNVLVALLYMYFPNGVRFPTNSLDSLNALAPAMALALDGAQSERTAALGAEAIRTERQRIARDLHDTLGQSLGYLQLKLDQLSGDDALREIVEIRQELERMRAVANESYEQVRGTVAALRPTTSTDLASTLLHHARTVGDRSGFEVELFHKGQPRPLASYVQRHIVYLIREALVNVEKHANARRVEIYLLWEEDTLCIILSDDGQGFDPSRRPPHGHFGLEIMHERAEEIQGELFLTSSPGSGTETTLLVPTVAPIPGSNGGGR